MNMKIIYVNCGVKSYMKVDHCSYRRNFCSCEKKAWKKKFFLFATSKVVSLTAMIYFHIILHPTVHIYDFHIFITTSSSFHGFITNKFNNLFPVGLLAQYNLVEHCTGIAEVKGFESCTSLNFFLLAFYKCKSCVYNYDDLLLPSLSMI